jgi:putative DNA primase/helicase
MKFLYEVMSSDDVEKFLDFVAYCLWREYKHHKWLLFNGSGRNGKGVTTNLVTALLGKENVSSESLQRLLRRDFSPAQLHGKLANIDADLSKDMLGNTGLLKKITGGDRITVEKKFKNPFDANIVAKLIFSANEVPKTSDESDAFFARLIIINFPKQFLGDDADPHLIDNLTTKQEISGFFNLVVSRVAKVLKDGITGSNKSLEDNYAKYIESSDPIRSFVETAIDRHANGNKESKDIVYNAYVDFCISKKLNPESQSSFSIRLTNDGFHQERIMQNRIRYYCWIGIKLKDWKQAEEGQETL